MEREKEIEKERDIDRETERNREGWGVARYITSGRRRERQINR